MVIEGGIDFCKNYNLIDELIQLWSYGPKSTEKKQFERTEHSTFRI